LGHSRKLAGLMGLSVAALLALPGLAHANTYCVATSSPGCIVEGDLQSALDAAKNNPGEDTVNIGAGTFSGGDSGFSYNSSGEVVRIVGAGAGTTVITANGAAATDLLVTAPPGSTVSSLSVRIPAASSNAVGLAAETSGSIPFGDHSLDVDHVSVTADATAAQPTGIALNRTGVANSSVDLSTITSDDGLALDVVSSGQTPVDPVEFLTLKAHTGVSSQFSRLTQLDVTAHRGVEVTASSSLISSLIKVTGTNGVGVQSDTSGGGLNMQLIDGTIVGDGSSGSIGVFGDDSGGNGGNIGVAGSIIQGFPTSISNQLDPSLGNGHNDYSGTLSGWTADPSDMTADPHFVNAPASPADPAADYRLRFDSPVIDHGTSSFGNLGPDLDGNSRNVGAGPDIGAYEYQHRPPAVTAAASPSPQFVGTPVTFEANGSDPDHGDTLTYQWTFDDGATATGASVQHAFATPGVHTATVTVTDPTSQTASAGTSATVVPVPPQQGPPSNLFTFGKLKVDTKHGWVILILDLSGAGKVSVLGNAQAVASKKKPKSVTVVKKTVVATKAGPLAITLKPTSKAMKLLRHNHSLKVPLKVTFTPTNGTPRTRRKPVTFKLGKQKHKR
jgi:hypothetical protein